MTLRTTFAVLALLICSAMAHGSDGRWNNFAEDSDLKYYLDQKSVVQYQDGVYLFWVKSVAKQKDYFKREYNLNNLSYILANYELDCCALSLPYPWHHHVRQEQKGAQQERQQRRRNLLRTGSARVGARVGAG